MKRLLSFFPLRIAFPRLPSWPARDWRMMVALLLLGIAGAGAWILNSDVLHHLAEIAERTGDIWPLAYYAFGALGILAITSIGFAMVVSLKSFRVDLPGGTGFGAEGGERTTSTTTTTTEIETPR